LPLTYIDNRIKLLNMIKILNLNKGAQVKKPSNASKRIQGVKNIAQIWLTTITSREIKFTIQDNLKEIKS